MTKVVRHVGRERNSNRRRFSMPSNDRAARQNLCAPVAQLDRALAYEARGRVFESPRAYQLSRLESESLALPSSSKMPETY